MGAQPFLHGLLNEETFDLCPREQPDCDTITEPSLQFDLGPCGVGPVVENDKEVGSLVREFEELGYDRRLAVPASFDDRHALAYGIESQPHCPVVKDHAIRFALDDHEPPCEERVRRIQT